MSAKSKFQRSIFMRMSIYAQNAHTMEPTADEVYERRLKKDIEKMEAFLAQAETAEALLQRRVQQTNVDPKIDTIALHHAASKLSYIPEKGDVLGMATASVKTQELVDESRDAYVHLKTFAKDRHEISETYRQLLDDYGEVTQAIDYELKNERSQHAEEEPSLDIKHQLDILDRKLVGASEHEQTLTKHLKRLVVTSLMIEGWDRDSIEFKEGSSMCMQLVQQLVQAAVDSQITEQPQWVNVRPDAVLQKFITQLMLGDMIYVEEVNGVQRLRLREYGL
ncbi:hypothetical protein PGUG_03964 [Meyerozyma guilliermondii ATCC 6260]|uniref:Uncharacterized protein n=1 Tax=Meyerozyma guilliermondii (strain ATCC 6260 / CBS 566 / DSM 6381 / JCM 1539 / NBRC 10279 / NRRL Y-324) TaxID=294746 RepID=A5DL13_PICGU|nr:uncharacterized protein PGUG_03964 [Meyerozyma guilliermondii ATCC 6260]EDK39866.2 hypothetical protein PGUG_03964 [Meyerozyma guilliermondii ATCC 6260]